MAGKRVLRSFKTFGTENLRHFAKTFPGHQTRDLIAEMLDKWLEPFAGLAIKTRNDRKAIVGIWLRWRGRKDYLEPTRMVTSETFTKVPTQEVFVRNYTNMQAVALGQQVSARGRLVGTIDVKGERLDVLKAYQEHPKRVCQN